LIDRDSIHELSFRLELSNNGTLQNSISESPSYVQTREMLDQVFEKDFDLTGPILYSE